MDPIVTTPHEKSGYLNQDFRLFHIRDQVEREFDFHYHDFNKIVVFLSGNVTYIIEGKSYYLKPWDILLVNHYDVHKPVIDASVPYERIIIWVKNDFITSYNDDVCDISSCFRKANARSFSLIRLDPRLRQHIQEILTGLEESLSSDEFGASLLASAQFVQLMVYLNRIFLEKQYIRDDRAIRFDKKIDEILRYINRSLDADLSVDALSETFFISKYHLMRKFKETTGFTLHRYVVQKRLLLANEYIKNGTPIQEAAQRSGFADYTTFSRAYKRMFHHPPSLQKE